MNLIELCQKAIAIDSSLSHGNSELADFFADVAIKAGLMVELLDDVHKGIPQKIIIVRTSGSRTEKDFLMSSQIETEDPVSYAVWTKTGSNPFNASIDGDGLYGLGSSGSKLDFVAKLYALMKFNKSDFKKLGPVLVGGFGGASGISGLKLLRRRFINPACAVVGGPTHLRMADRGPGYAEIEVRIPYSDEERKHLQKLQFQENAVTQSKFFTADKSLTSERDFSENPIVQMLAYLKNLPEGMVLVSADGGQSPSAPPDAAWLEIEVFDGLRDTLIPKLVKLHDILLNFVGEFRQVKDPSFSPKHSTIQLGRINTQPDCLSILGSCHFVPQVTHDLYEKWLSDLQKACESIGAQFQLLDFREPFHGPLDGELGKTFKTILEEKGLSTEPTVARRGSEANLFPRFKIQTLVFGAGRVVGTQLANEHISIADLRSSTEVYEQLIQRICK